MSDEAECLDWLVSLSATLAKAPYKDTDNALTLVNTNRTDVSLTISNVGMPAPKLHFPTGRRLLWLRC